MLYNFNANFIKSAYYQLMSIIKDFIFLLGGYDLEMVEIRNLLFAYKASSTPEFQIDFIDKQLQWGAKLSNYNDLIPSLNGESGQIDHLIPEQIDHFGKGCFRPTFRSKLTTCFPE